jgi:hypothetical protein
MVTLIVQLISGVASHGQIRNLVIVILVEGPISIRRSLLRVIVVPRVSRLSLLSTWKHLQLLLILTPVERNRLSR